MRTNLSNDLAAFLNGLCQGGVGGTFYVIDLYTITLVSGSVLRLCSWDTDIVYGGNTYSSAYPYVQRSKVMQSLGLDASEVEVNIYAPPTAEVDLTPVLYAIAHGAFCGAEFRIDRLFMQTLGDVSLGTLLWFMGRDVEVLEVGRTHGQLRVKDKRALLNAQFPRSLYQPGCRHVLGDAGCGVNLVGLTTSGAVAAGSNRSVIQTNLSAAGPLTAPVDAPSVSQAESSDSGVNLPYPATYYVVITYVGPYGESLPSPRTSISVNSTLSLITVSYPPSIAGATGWNVYIGKAWGNEQRQNDIALGFSSDWTMPGSGLLQGPSAPIFASGGYFTAGTITFTSGDLSGLSRFVSQYEGDGSVAVIPPLPSVPAEGDTFAIRPGCDKQQLTCQTKFNNLINFGGQPYVPTPEQGI